MLTASKTVKIIKGNAASHWHLGNVMVSSFFMIFAGFDRVAIIMMDKLQFLFILIYLLNFRVANTRS